MSSATLALRSKCFTQFARSEVAARSCSPHCGVDRVRSSEPHILLPLITLTKRFLLIICGSGLIGQWLICILSRIKRKKDVYFSR
jgi:hypothetical protein